MKRRMLLVLGGIAAAVVLFVLAGLLVSPKRKVSRSVEVDAPPAKVYPLIADLKHGWSKWSPLAAQREGVSYAFSGPESGVAPRSRGRAGRATATSCSPAPRPTPSSPTRPTPASRG